MSIVEQLRAVPLFQGMTDRSIERIGELARPVSFAAGDRMTTEGARGDTFIVLTSGTADVTQGGRTLRTLGPGDFLGEISLIDSGPRTATVTATSTIDALVIDRAGFERLMSDFPVVRHDLVSALTNRLRERAPALSD